MNKGLLAIVYYFPPMGSVCVHRTFPFLDGISRTGLPTSIIQAQYNVIPNYKHYDLSAFEEIHQIPNYDYRWIKKTAMRRVHRNPTSSLLHSFHPIFAFLESPLGALTLGEGGGWYLIQAYRKAKKIIEDQDIEYLYTSYRPLTDMMVAYLLKKRFPHLRWIADMRDYYFRYDTKNYFSRKLRLLFFKKLLNRADQIITVSEGIADKMAVELERTIRVIPNGVHLYDKPLPNQSLKFSISYTGSLYSFYDIDVFFKSLLEWIRSYEIPKEDIQLIYAGKDAAVWNEHVERYDLKDISVIHHVLPREQARDIQAKSHINLLFSYSTEEYKGVVTGKLYDLIGVQRPIMCLINGDPDKDLSQYFTQLQCGKIFSSSTFSAKVFANFFHRYYIHWKETGSIPQLDNKDLMRDYTWEKRLQQLMRYLCPQQNSDQ